MALEIIFGAAMFSWNANIGDIYWHPYTGLRDFKSEFTLLGGKNLEIRHGDNMVIIKCYCRSIRLTIHIDEEPPVKQMTDLAQLRYHSDIRVCVCGPDRHALEHWNLFTLCIYLFTLFIYLFM